MPVVQCRCVTQHGALLVWLAAGALVTAIILFASQYQNNINATRSLTLLTAPAIRAHMIDSFCSDLRRRINRANRLIHVSAYTRVAPASQSWRSASNSSKKSTLQATTAENLLEVIAMLCRPLSPLSYWTPFGSSHLVTCMSIVGGAHGRRSYRSRSKCSI